MEGAGLIYIFQSFLYFSVKNAILYNVFDFLITFGLLIMVALLFSSIWVIILLKILMLCGLF
jgi:hypothetical protein